MIRTCSFIKRDGVRCKIKTPNTYCSIHMKECSICYEKLHTEETKKIECNHFFHKRCIDDWFERENTCPLCRHKVDLNKFQVQIANNPLLIEMNVKFFLEKLRDLEGKGKFTGNKLFIDAINKDTAGVYKYHDGELLGTFKLS